MKRESLYRLYDNIYEKYKDNVYIDDPEQLYKQLKQKTIKECILIFKAISVNINDKHLLSKYNVIIDRLKKLDNSNWLSCVDIAKVNLKKRSNYNNNDLVTLLVMLYIRYRFKVIELSELRYNNNVIYCRNKQYKLDNDIIVLLEKYVKSYNIPNDEILFDMSTKSISNILNRIFSKNVQSINNSYLEYMYDKLNVI